MSFKYILTYGIINLLFMPVALATTDSLSSLEDRVQLVITDDPNVTLQLEVKQASLNEVLAIISSKTGVVIHYSVLPEGLVSAICVGATPQKIVECLLARKADLIVRNQEKTAKAAEMWILGTRYSDVINCTAATSPVSPALTQTVTATPQSPFNAQETEQVEELLAQAKSKDNTLRASVIGALMSVGKAGDAKIQRVLEAALTDPDASVRAQAVSSLTHRDGAAAIPVLQNALQDSDASVRLMAVDGIVDDAALLQQAINDDDETVRQLAITKLEALQKKSSH